MNSYTYDNRYYPQESSSSTVDNNITGITILDTIINTIDWVMDHKILTFLGLLLCAACVYWLYMRFLCWWFHDNKAAIRMMRKRKQIREDFNLPFGLISRRGYITMQPRTAEKWERPSLSKELSNALKTHVSLSFKDGKVKISDPIVIPSRVTGVPTYSDDGIASIGIDTNTGKRAKFSIKNVSLILFAGQSGSGKTIAMTNLTQALSRNSHAHVQSVNLKVDDIDRATHLLEKVWALAEKRLRSDTDYWSNPRGKKLVVLAIDECQDLFTLELDRDSKEAKERLQRRILLVTNLAKKARSAGVILILATQKPTTDAIPSGIRDQAGVRFAFRMMNREGVRAILGDIDLPPDSNFALLPTGQCFVFDGRSITQQKVYYTG